VHVRRGDQPGRRSGLIGSSAELVRVNAPRRYHVAMDGPERCGGVGSVVLAAVLIVLFSNGFMAAQATDHERVEGTVEAIQGPNMILVRTRDRLVTVDLSALGGVTAALTRGQKIVAIGTMEASGDVIHATNLEPSTSP
jgi:hypothetical protein